MEALRKWIVLIRRGDDLHCTFGVAYQPHPAAAKLRYSGGIKFLLKSFEVAERFLNGIGDGATRVASALGLHDLPEHGVVDVSAAIVAHSGANVFRHGVQIAEEIFRGLFVEVRVFIL